MKTHWEIAALVLLGALALAVAAAFRGDRGDRLVGVEASSVVLTLFVVAYAQATGRPAILDLAVASSALAFGGALVFTRFLERWL